MTATRQFPTLAECLPTSLGVADVVLTKVEALPPQPPTNCPRWTPHLHGNAKEVWVEFEEAGRWRIREGSSMEVQPVVGSSWDRILCMSMATPLGVLILQHGNLPMHAASLVAPGATSATLLCADSGTGKSTTAAALCLRGWTILADDLTQVARRNDKLVALPGWATIKLWPASCELLGFPKEELPAHPGLKDKRLWKPPLIGTSPIPISDVLVLRREEAEGSLRVAELHGLETISTLREQTFRPGLVSRLERSATQFEACAALAKQAKICRLEVPLGVGPQELAGWIEDHVLARQRS